MKPKPIATNIILYCRAFRETVRFYRDRMQLPVCFSTDWFVEFRLNEMSRLSVADEQHTSINSSAGEGITLALQVEDVQAAWNKARQQALDPTAIREHPWNARVFHLADPEGHRIEIWQST